jgi:hypothetical protein
MRLGTEPWKSMKTINGHPCLKEHANEPLRRAPRILNHFQARARLPSCMIRRVVERPVVPGGRRLIRGERHVTRNNRLTSGHCSPDKHGFDFSCCKSTACPCLRVDGHAVSASTFPRLTQSGISSFCLPALQL